MATNPKGLLKIRLNQPPLTWDEAKRQTREQLRGKTSEDDTKPKAVSFSNGQNGKAES